MRTKPRATRQATRQHAIQPTLDASTDDLAHWLAETLHNPVPGDWAYHHMTTQQLEALAGARGLYAVQAWRERQRRSRNR